MKTKIKSLLVVFIIFFIPFRIWSSYPVQEFVAPMYGFMGAEVDDLFDDIAEKMPSWMLVRQIDDGNFYLAGSALTQLCAREDNPKYFNFVKKMTEHKHRDVRERAYKVLFCLDRQRAYDFYLEGLKRLDPDSREYEISLLSSVQSESRDLFPYLLDYFRQPMKWNRAAAYLERYGDPAALPLLYEIREKVQTKEYRKFLFKDTLAKLDQAIEKLTTKGVKS